MLVSKGGLIERRLNRDRLGLNRAVMVYNNVIDHVTLLFNVPDKFQSQFCKEGI